MEVMTDMLDQAKLAASRICGTVRYVHHASILPTGEQVFRVGVTDHEHEATVTLNPNGHSAGVEWRDRYRVFKTNGLVGEGS
jgi:hypothetical protein